ncbi:hypothetical protein Hjap01_03766 [Haloarcula japonica]
MSFVVAYPCNNLSEGNVCSNVGNLHSNTLPNLSIGNNHYEPSLNTRESIALVAETLDVDGTLFAFRNWRRLWLL